MKMLFLIILGLTVFAQIDARAIINADVNIQECVKEHKLDINQLSKAVFTGPTVNEDNESFNILAGCLWDKEGIWAEDHDINDAALIRHIQKVAANNIGGDAKDYIELSKEIAKDCKGLTGNNYGETATKIQNCINTKTVEHKH